MRRLLFVCLLLSSSCAGKIDREDTSLEVHGSAETIEKVRTAIQSWNAICGTNLSLVSSHGAVVITETEESSLAAAYPGYCPCKGVTFGKKTDNLFPDGIYLEPNPPLPTIEHELGHVLGLAHLPHGLMSYEPDDKRFVSDYECQALIETNAEHRAGLHAP